MNVHVRTEGLNLEPAARRLLEIKSRSLGQRLARYVEESDQPLEVRVRKGANGECRVDLDLTLQGDHLHVSREDASPFQAVRESMRALFRQYDKWRLHRNPALRLRVRRRLDRLMAGDPVPDLKPIRETLPDEIAGELLAHARGLALQEIALQQGLGNLEPGWVDPEEIVEEVLVATLPELASRELSIVEAKRLLYAGVQAAVQAHAEQMLEAAETLVSVEEDVPEVDDGLALSELGDHVLDFWVMDEDLKMEDLVEDPSGKSPEEIVADKEARRVLINALMQLPPDLRYVYAELVMDEAAIEDVMEYMGHSRDEVRRDFVLATERLVEQLSGPTVRYRPEDVHEMYRELARSFQVDAAAMARARA